ncbi:MAG: integrase [Gammaproteobacteria bacterium]|nr:integrase [Gammaproteobacteria bacterium]
MDASYPASLQQMLSLIRARHYSIRTEQSYIDWVTRFMRGCAGQSIAEVKRTDVGRYLSYLATARTV